MCHPHQCCLLSLHTVIVYCHCNDIFRLPLIILSLFSVRPMRLFSYRITEADRAAITGCLGDQGLSRNGRTGQRSYRILVTIISNNSLILLIFIHHNSRHSCCFCCWWWYVISLFHNYDHFYSTKMSDKNKPRQEGRQICTMYKHI